MQVDVPGDPVDFFLCLGVEGDLHHVPAGEVQAQLAVSRVVHDRDRRIGGTPIRPVGWDVPRAHRSDATSGPGRVRAGSYLWVMATMPTTIAKMQTAPARAAIEQSRPPRGS